MVRYYVNRNAQANGGHEVHVSSCSFFPEPENRIYLGEFFSCHEAVVEEESTTYNLTVATAAARRVTRARGRF
jgi:hypothetical protein